jgi:uncharacterized cupin superfamily protein
VQIPGQLSVQINSLGNEFGLQNFGVNLTQLEPGSVAALLHSHTKQDEFIYVLEGAPTLICDGSECELRRDYLSFPEWMELRTRLENT